MWVGWRRGWRLGIVQGYAIILLSPLVWYLVYLAFR